MTSEVKRKTVAAAGVWRFSWLVYRYRAAGDRPASLRRPHLILLINLLESSTGFRSLDPWACIFLVLFLLPLLWIRLLGFSAQKNR